MTSDDRTDDLPVVVVGGGLSGLATALGCTLRGRRVVVLEAADQLGGAAAWSGGQVWVGANHVAAAAGVDDDLDRTERYVRGLAHEHPELLDESALRRWLGAAPAAMRYWEEAGAVRWTVIEGLADYHADVDGALSSGRYLTTLPVDAQGLGPWRDRLRVSPWFRPGTTYEELFAKGRRTTTASTDAAAADRLTLGAGLVAGFLARLVQEEQFALFPGTRVTELLRDERGGVVGVRAQGPSGGRGAAVEHRGPVVLATSSFDHDPALVRDLLGLSSEDFGSIAPETIRGDGLRLAREVGAKVARIPATSVPMVPGWRLASGEVVNGPEYAMPHAFVVDRSGRRFGNDSYWPDLVRRGLDPADRHLPFFLIMDEEHHRRYGLGSTAPGDPYPAGLVASAPTLRELGAALGIDGDQLEATAARFNSAAERGEDPEFGRGSIDFVNRFSGDPSHRPSPVLGPVAEPPFHGLRLLWVGTAIGSSGVHIDADGHVLDELGASIPGLWAVGSCAATTTFGSGYNSGMALSRGLTLAHLVAAELSDAPIATTD
jgi:3-oxosteroid 1-dehydrogenase